MMITTVHTNISSTSVVDGITVLRMMVVDAGRLVWLSVGCCCVGRDMLGVAVTVAGLDKVGVEMTGDNVGVEMTGDG